MFSVLHTVLKNMRMSGDCPELRNESSRNKAITKGTVNSINWRNNITK